MLFTFEDGHHLINQVAVILKNIHIFVAEKFQRFQKY